MTKFELSAKSQIYSALFNIKVININTLLGLLLVQVEL